MAVLRSPCRGCKAFKYVRDGMLAGPRTVRWMFTQYQKAQQRWSKWKRHMTFFPCQNRKGSVPTWAPSGQIIKIHLWLCTQLKCQGNVLWILRPFFYSARLCTKTNWISVNGTKYVPGTALNLIVSLCAGGSGTSPHANQRGWNLNRWPT